MEKSTLESILALMVPAEVLESFTYRDLLEDNKSVTIVLGEKETLTPEPLQSLPESEIALNGFCNPVEIRTFPQKGKATYLRLYRRRWKRRGHKESFSNTYNFHEPEAKLTDPLAFFLKRNT